MISMLVKKNFIIDHWLCHFTSYLRPPEAKSYRLRPFPGLPDTYSESYRYDEVWPRHEAMVARFAMLCEGVSSPILDLGGGTGILARLLVRSGHKVILVDRSRRMLQTAKERRAQLSVQEKERFVIRENDIERVSFNQSFDRIFAIGGPISFVIGEDRILKTLRRIYRFLKPGGIFYMDFFTFAHWRSFRSFKTGRWQYWINKQTPSGPIHTWVKNYDGFEPNEVVFEYAMATRHLPLFYYHDKTSISMFEDEYWKSLVEKAGFRILNFFDDWQDEFNNKPPTMNTQYTLHTLKLTRDETADG